MVDLLVNVIACWTGHEGNKDESEGMNHGILQIEGISRRFYDRESSSYNVGGLCSQKLPICWVVEQHCENQAEAP